MLRFFGNIENYSDIKWETSLTWQVNLLRKKNQPTTRHYKGITEHEKTHVYKFFELQIYYIKLGYYNLKK